MLMAVGCANPSRAQLEAQQAMLVKQNEELKRQLAAQSKGVTIVGPVENSFVPWVAGLTLAQALATANYLDPKAPKKIIITRDGETASLDAQALLNGAVVPLKPGDVVELDLR